MQLLNRYIRNTILMSTGIVVLVLLAIESFMELVGQLGSIGKYHYTVLTAMMYVPMQLPNDLYQLFPMAGFLGCLIGLGRLANTSELTVMRAASVSIGQIAWSVIKAAILMIVIMTIIGETAAPWLQAKSAHMRAHALGRVEGSGKLEGAWLRQGNTFMMIGESKNVQEMKHIYLYHFGNNHQLHSATYAYSAHRNSQGWVLNNAKTTYFHPNSINSGTTAMAPLKIAFKPHLLQQSSLTLDQNSAYSLFRNITYRQKAGLVSSQFEFAFWQRIIQPFTTIVMICLGIPFVFGSLRSASMSSRVLTGILVGFFFYTANQFFGPISMVYQFPPFLAAALPTVLFIITYLVLLRWVR